MTMRILVNGLEEEVAGDLALAGYLDEKGLDRRFLVVEYNGEALPREDFERVVLRDGDRLELVRPVAGG